MASDEGTSDAAPGECTAVDIEFEIPPELRALLLTVLQPAAFNDEERYLISRFFTVEEGWGGVLNDMHPDCCSIRMRLGMVFAHEANSRPAHRSDALHGHRPSRLPAQRGAPLR